MKKMPWNLAKLWPFKRNLNNPNLPLNDAKVWAEVFGDYFGSYSGESITAQRAMEFAPYWQAVTMISGDIGRLPLRLYERSYEQGQEVRRLNREDYRADLVNRTPNDFFSASQFWSRAVVALLVWGRACIEIVRRRDLTPAQLLLLNPSLTKVDADETGRIFIKLDTAIPRVISPANCLYLEWAGWNEIDVLTPYQQARHAIGLGLAQERFASLFECSDQRARRAEGGRHGPSLDKDRHVAVLHARVDHA